MNKKFICIIICVLLTTLVLPTSASILKQSKFSDQIILPLNENQPPEPPVMVDGPIYGEKRTLHKFTFIAEDPDGDDIYFYIDWSDGDFVFWDGPYPSGQEVTFGHAWQTGGDYTLRVKAKDQHDAESNLSYFDMKVLLRGRTVINPIFIFILERFPHAFPLLRSLIL